MTNLKKISENIYEIEKEGKMNVKGLIYASEKIIESIKMDKTLEQVKNVASLPGIVSFSIALSDAHQGYGFSIGGVAAFDSEKGIISPGGVGYDINCGVRLLKTNLKKKDIIKKQGELMESLYKKIPSGVGRGSPYNMTKVELKKVLNGGAKYLIEKGYGKKDDYIYIEEEGCLKNSNAEKVSERAMKRGIGQLGTLGSGNHFLEVQYVDEVFDKNAAKNYGLEKDQAVIMIHCGSRGLGHQVASDYIQLMEKEYGIKNLPDRELINAPIKSKLGKDYIEAMNCAANFAFANRQLITHWLREAFKKIYDNSEIDILYDVCHNIAKFEDYKIDGKIRKLCVHRKGATRGFGPGSIEIPKKYLKIGQPVLIPGSMGTSSYVLAGTKKAQETTFGSTVHGAGRITSRSKAIKTINVQKIKNDLSKKGILIKAGSDKSVAEEAPEVYKDIEEVIKVVDDLGISKKVARLKPLIVVKG